MFFAAEDKKQDKVDSLPFPVYKGTGDQGRHQEVHGQDADALGHEEADGDRRGRQGLPEDHRAPAGAAAALGHRGRVARRADVGQLRRRLPQGALPQGLGQEGLRAGDGRHALLERGQGELPRAPRRGVRAHQARQGEAGAQALPRRLGEVPVLRRVLARLREVAREELQDRIPRRRRAPRRAHAVERRPRRPSAAAHHRRPALAPGRDRARHREGRGRRLGRHGSRGTARSPLPAEERREEASTEERQRG